MNKSNVDQAYLKMVGDQIRHIKNASYSLMNIKTGCRVLDSGCGPGIDTCSLGGLIGPQGSVTGVDFDETMITAAKNKAKDMGFDAFVYHQLADSTDLPFEKNCFDASRSERLFQHLSDPSKALSELIRVTKPSGKIVVLDTDWASTSLYTENFDIERKLQRIAAENYLKSGYAARSLLRLFQVSNQITSIQLDVLPQYFRSYQMVREMKLLEAAEKIGISMNVFTKNEIQKFYRNLEEADKNGYFFCSVNFILISGIVI